MTEFKNVPLASLRDLRERYLASLRYPQELHCEWLVAKGACFVIEADGERVGYFICSEDGQLVEFYLLDKMFARKKKSSEGCWKSFRLKVLSVSLLMICL